MVVEVFDVLRELRDQGVTVLLVEQNATQAIALADRTYVLRTGDLVMHGTRAELQARDDIQDAYLGTVAAS
jgi:branched-chain amino acid transport system ATP-binding protein